MKAIRVSQEHEQRLAQLKSEYSTLAPPQRRQKNKSAEEEAAAFQGEIADLKKRNDALQAHIKLLTSSLAKQEKEAREKAKAAKKNDNTQELRKLKSDLNAANVAGERQRGEIEANEDTIADLKKEVARLNQCEARSATLESQLVDAQKNAERRLHAEREAVEETLLEATHLTRALPLPLTLDPP